MAKTIKGILIDAFNKTIEEVTFKATLQEYYRLLNCSTITAVYPTELYPKDLGYADDEGMFGAQDFIKFGESQIWAGSVLIIGNDGEGGTISTTRTVEEIKALVTFMDAKDAMLAANILGI